MENGSNFPASWSYASNNPSNTNYQFDWSTEAASSGTHSLKITSSINNGPNFGYWYQTVSYANPGKTVQLSVKIKIVNVIAANPGIGASIALAGFSGSDQTQFVSSGNATPIVGTSDWSIYTVKISNIASGTDKLVVYLPLGTQTTGTVYFDEVSLKEVN